MLESVSWLAMDEPTNHLDLAARTALEEMLGEFDGALLCVSHDREFLDGLCTHILEVGPKVELVPGNYSAWRARKEAEAAERAAERQAQPKAPAATRKDPAPASGGRVRNPYLFAKLEQRIIGLEEERDRLHAECSNEEVYRDAERLKEAQVRLAELEDELEEANETWANWS
jgi:ATP-binding cassette subfamily F protein 3